MSAANATFRDSFRIVLVEPGESLNVGAVARAMGNFGFSHLHLIAPRGYDRARAAVTACWAEPLLGRLTIHATLDDALTDAQTVVGFSMRAGSDTPPHFVTLPRWLEALSTTVSDASVTMPRTALVFGPEENGLRLEDLARCRWVVRIPTATDCPSLNLAQSVLLVLYELAKREPDIEVAEDTAADLPTGNERQQVERLLDGIMGGSGFVRPGSPAHVPGVVRGLFRRLDLNKREIGVLLGLLGRVNTVLGRIALTPGHPEGDRG